MYRSSDTAQRKPRSTLTDEKNYSKRFPDLSISPILSLTYTTVATI